MTSVTMTKYQIEIGEHTLLLDKECVDKFVDVVCPLSEKYLFSQLKIFGKDTSNDKLISAMNWS